MINSNSVLNNFIYLPLIREGCFSFKRWMRYKVLWLSYTISESSFLTYSTLIVSNVGLYKIAFTVAQVVYHFFPDPDRLTETQKICKDLSVFGTWISVYTISNIGISKLLDLPLSTTFHATISSVIFVACIYLKI